MTPSIQLVRTFAYDLAKTECTRHKQAQLAARIDDDFHNRAIAAWLRVACEFDAVTWVGQRVWDYCQDDATWQGYLKTELESLWETYATQIDRLLDPWYQGDCRY